MNKIVQMSKFSSFDFSNATFFNVLMNESERQQLCSWNFIITGNYSKLNEQILTPISLIEKSGEIDQK